MFNGNLLFLLITAALMIAALTIGYVAVLEVVRVLRDFFTRVAASSEVSSDSRRLQERSSELRSRAAVKRLITHFEEPGSGKSPDAQEE